MAILKTEAVILRGWKLRETSMILCMLTRDFGKVKVVAKGGRELKSKFRGCLEPLTHIRIVYYDKRTRDLQLLSQIDLIDPHYHIIGNIEKTYLGLAVAELLDKAVIGEERFPDIFDLVISTLKILESEDGFLEGIIWYFQSRFIDLMGYKPTWHFCLDCKASLGANGGFFQPRSGGMLCNSCGSLHGGLVVQGETLEILYWLQGETLKEAAKLNPEPIQKAEIRKMFDSYFKTHIDHLKSLRSLELYYEQN